MDQPVPNRASLGKQAADSFQCIPRQEQLGTKSCDIVPVTFPVFQNRSREQTFLSDHLNSFVEPTPAAQI
jgi:hypothetical protein